MKAMTASLKEAFALTGEGARSLDKAIWACAVTDLALALPIGILCKLMSDLIDVRALGDASLSPWRYLALSIGALALLFLCEFAQYNATFLASYGESARQRIDLAEWLRRLPLSFFGRRDLSDLTSTVMADCASVETAFSHFIPELFGALFSLVPISIGLLILDWRMALALIWVIPVAFVLVLATKRFQDRFGRRTKADRLRYADGIQECIENVADLKASDQSAAYLARLDGLFCAFEKSSIHGELLVGVCVTCAQMMLKVGLATTILAGSLLVQRGSIDALTLLIFLIAATRIYEPLSVSLQNLAAVFATLLTVARMRELRSQPLQPGEGEGDYAGYDIEFKDVDFTYGEAEHVLRGVSFTARQGEITALVGPSGGGKSTAARLAARFWDAQRGTISLGGVDVRAIDPELYLKNFAIVFQDVTLFDDTVLENIRVGREGASDEEVLAAAKAAQCDEFVSRLPRGYRTVIGENGSALSGGERQRLSIARALLKDAPVVLLDEATASLDVESESRVQAAIGRLIQGRTVLIIAHRMRTVAKADQVIVLAEGRVAEAGRPAELMAREGGLFRRMVALQTESQRWSIGGEQGVGAPARGRLGERHV